MTPVAGHRLALNELFRRSMLPCAAIKGARHRMAAPRRHYHGLDHIACLWTQHRRLSRGTIFRTSRVERLIATAIIFHDAILDPRRSDNEAASARLWRRRAAIGCRLPRRFIERVACIIEATAGHAAGHREAGCDDPAARWLLDLDLTPIGAPPHRFRSNSSALRAEFVFMAAADWERRTRDFLHALAQRTPIYYSPRIAAAFAAAAHANLAREPKIPVKPAGRPRTRRVSPDRQPRGR